jgi:DNA primase
MSRRYPKELLHRIRNEIDIREVVRILEIPWKISEGYFRFLCPQCSEFNTATNPRTNLGRCFRCRRNFNPIDLIMAVRVQSFLESVDFLSQLLASMPNREYPQLNRKSIRRPERGTSQS